MDSKFIYFADEDISKELKELEHNKIYPFISNGRWAMHDLLIYLLSLTGPATVKFSTFSIFEPAIRAISNAVEEGKITEITALFDYTVKTNKLDVLYFADNVIKNIYLLPNHSKIILINNSDWLITVIGSANMSPNPRREAGVIFTDTENYVQFGSRFNKFIKEARKYEP